MQGTSASSIESTWRPLCNNVSDPVPSHLPHLTSLLKQQNISASEASPSHLPAPKADSGGPSEPGPSCPTPTFARITVCPPRPCPPPHPQLVAPRFHCSGMAMGTISEVSDNQRILWVDVTQAYFEQALERPWGLLSHGWCISNGPVSCFLPLGSLITLAFQCLHCARQMVLCLFEALGLSSCQDTSVCEVCHLNHERCSVLMLWRAQCMSQEQGWPLGGITWRMGVKEQEWVVELEGGPEAVSAEGSGGEPEGGLQAVPTGGSGGSGGRSAIWVGGWGWPVVLIMRQVAQSG